MKAEERKPVKFKKGDRVRLTATARDMRIGHGGARTGSVFAGRGVGVPDNMSVLRDGSLAPELFHRGWWELESTVVIAKRTCSEDNATLRAACAEAIGCLPH